jgi:hypothetical protein
LQPGDASDQTTEWVDQGSLLLPNRWPASLRAGRPPFGPFRPAGRSRRAARRLGSRDDVSVRQASGDDL